LDDGIWCKNKIGDEVIILKAIYMETQPKFLTTSSTLCELHKCGASLEINEKVKEYIERC
jgi:hypothetical protein